jgi:predicted dehydrogenase
MPMKLGMLGMWHTHATGIVRQAAGHADEFELVAFYDADPDVVRQRQRDWQPLVGELPLFDRPEQVLAQRLDGVVVEGRVSENLQLARLAVEAAFPVMLEKPAGENLADFRDLLDLARSEGLHVQMLYLFRYMSAVLEMLRMARDGEFGRIYQFRARLPKDFTLYDEYVHDLGRYRGGIFFEMAGHVVDMMATLLGRPTRVTPFLAHHHIEPSDFVDHGVAVFEYDRAFGLIDVSALEVVPDARRIEVFGTEGACSITHLGSGHLRNDPVQPIHVYRAGAERWNKIDLPAATLQSADLREFAAVVAGKKKPDYAMDHDLIVQETLLEACGFPIREHS